MNVIIKPSNNQNKKIMAIIDDGKKTLHFGDSRYSDYTQTKDDKRKKLIQHGISTTITPTLYIHHSTLLICYGINQH